jgi:gliding motility-associated-like protein
MKKTTTNLFLFLCFFTISYAYKAQSEDVRIKTNYFFATDSIDGFDEVSAKAIALENKLFGQEFKYFMYEQKRLFVKEKFNLRTTYPDYHPVAPFSSRLNSALPSSGACNNDDFEDQTGLAGPNIGGPVAGWTLFGGVGSVAANFCTPSALAATANYTVFNAPIIDPIMTAPNNTVFSYFSATSLTQPAGSSFIRLNNQSAGAKVVRLSKTYNVSPSNAIFRYAYRAVLCNPNHSCCQQPGFKIRVTVTNTVSGTSTVLACPNITVAAGNACGPSAGGFVTGNILTGSPSSFNPAWVPGAIDLSPYLGNNVTLDVFAIDCAPSAHAGYVYFDALCQPMTVVGNGNLFPAGTNSILIPTCGAAGATITAPPGLGPYTWTSSAITIPPGFATPTFTNTTLVTSQNGTVDLIMNPAGSCAPIVKTLSVINTQAPQALITVSNVACPPGPTIACVSLTTAGSASVAPTIVWTPTPGSLSSNSLQACGFTPTLGNVTVYDTYSCSITRTFVITPAPPIPSFTLQNSTGSFSVTCLNPVINMSVLTTYTPPANFFWFSSPTTFTSNGTSAALTNTNLGNYTVTMTDPATSCAVSQTFAIGINTTIPTSTLNATSGTINCSSGIPTFTNTVISPTTNATTAWFSPPGGVFPTIPSSGPNTGSVSIYNPPVGQTTVLTCNQVNGCCNTKTINITTTSYFPTFVPTSNTNFTVGCAPNNTTTLCFASATSTNGSVDFCFYPGNTQTTTIPTGSFSGGPGASCLTTSITGQWNLVLRDVVSGCQTSLPVFVLANTVTPHVSAAIPTTTLTCFNPTVLAVGSSTTPNTNVVWNYPTPAPNTTTSNSLTVGFPFGPATCTNCSGNWGTATVVATNTLNSCRTTQTVGISQNFLIPNIVTAISNSAVINCKTPTVQIAVTNVSVTGGLSVAASNTFIAPPPLSYSAGGAGVVSFVGAGPGIYTITSQINFNGCTSTITRTVTENTIKPVINPVVTATLPCAVSATNQGAPVTVVLTNTLTNWSFFLGGTPSNSTSVSNPTILSFPGQSVSAAQYTFSVDEVGEYGFTVIDNVSGCSENGEFIVVPGGLVAGFEPEVINGFAPLSVNFSNTSFAQGASGNTASITTQWNFGNGTYSVTPSVAVSPNALYTNPGTYTVLIVSTKGLGCVDSAYKVINVDIPSKLEVPNVFTPNGDNSNDVFFVKASNLTEITAVIFDRWGNKVYDVVSKTGNIAWDGKNFKGQECPSGTYFYVIKGSGKDGTEYEKKGNLSLFR